MFKRLQHIIVILMMIFSTTQAFAQIAMPDTVCVGATKTYKVNDPGVPSTYTWKVDGSTQAAFTNQISITWNTAGTFLVEVQEHGAGGCDGDSQSGIVYVIPFPTASISGITPVCQNGSSDITFTNPQNLPVTITYNINGGTNAAINVAANSTTTLPVPTNVAGFFTYNLVSAAYQGVATCTQSISGSVTIIVIAQPSITFDPNLSGCVGSTTALLSYTNPTDNPVTYSISWNTAALTAGFTDVNGFTLSNPVNITVPASAPAGTYTGVIYINNGSCLTPYPFSVTITAKPVADAPPDVTACASYTLPPLANGAYFSLPNGVGPIPVGTVISTTQTIYVYAGTAFCFDEHSFTVTITPFVTPSVSIAASSTSICLGNSVTFTATPVNPGAAPLYQWKLNGTDIPGATSLTYTTNTLSNGDKITFVMVSNAPCATVTNVTSNEIQVTVTSVTPAVSITATTTTICAGFSITFAATPVNGGSAPAYQWQINGTDVPGATSLTYTTTALNNGDKVTVVITSNANCTTTPVATSNQIVIVVNPIPVIIITDPAGVCSPGTVDITASSVSAGSDAGLTFTYFTDATATTTLSNANAVAVSGTYYIKGTSAAGCVSIKPVVVTINPLPNFIITNPAAVCSPATVDITTATVTAGSDAGLSFSYFTDAAATNVLNNPNAVNASGTYFIKAVTVFGCVTIKPVTVIINPLPTAVITGNGVLCRGVSKTLDIILTGTSPFTVTYSNGTSTFTINGINASPYKLVVSPIVNTTYSLISVTDANCSNTAAGSAAISVGTPITPVRYTTINATAFLPKDLFPPGARVFSPNDQYAWNPAVGLNAYSIPNPIFNYGQTTEYFITIAAGTGCTVVDTLLVKVFPASAAPAQFSDVFVPKVFSPNGDGHNDKLTPLLFRIKEFKHFRVFNRWGQLVFETKIPGEGWDGTFKGVAQGADVFTWTLEATGTDDRTHNKRGQTILLR